MSLILTLRVPDGIVAAADSLSTAQNLLEIVADEIKMECPNCKKEFSKPELRLPPFPVPFSASSYTQKLFSLFGQFALGCHGRGIINKRSTYYHVNKFQMDHKGMETQTLTQIRDAFIKYIEEQLLAELPKYKEEAPEKWLPFGFHLNGYEAVDGSPVGVTYEVMIGRKNVINRYDVLGCTVGGDIRVVQKLWEIGKENPRREFKYPLFSLQDAIDLSEFLISATSSFQKFSSDVPTVGGQVDVALVTPFHHFQWIKRKTLMEKLEVSNE